MLDGVRFESPFAETASAEEESETEWGRLESASEQEIFTESFRDESFRDESFREESFRDESFRDESFRDESFRDESFRDESFRDESFRDESFRDESFRDQEGPPLTEDETFLSGLVLRPAAGATGPGEEHWDPTGANLPLLDTGPSVRSKKVSANFTVAELVTSGGRPADVARISPVLVRLLQAIRTRVGRPVTITSGYRSWKRNGVVYMGYGKPPTLSQHCAGKAADIKIAGMTGMEIAKIAIDVWGPKVATGIGPDYAHVDVRGRGDTWTYLGAGTLKNSAALAELARYRKQHRGAVTPSVVPPPPPVPPAPLPLIPGTTKAGSLVVRSIPLLAKHRGTRPDLLLGWNAMTNPSAIDVVVHLHGFSPSASGMRIDAEKKPISGLDLGSRTRPTLTVLPRGDFYGGTSGTGYDFPALTPAGALDALTKDALARFTRATGLNAPRGRLILTAHSGGGRAMLAILTRSDPDEVHVFDALYQPATALAQWAAKRIAAGTGGAMRVFYRAGSAKHPGTQPASEALGRTLCALLAAAPPSVRARFRVERTSVAHGAVPGRYGGALLADAGSDVADARPFVCPPGGGGKESLETEAASGWTGWTEALAGTGEQPEIEELPAAEDEDGEVESAEVAASEAEGRDAAAGITEDLHTLSSEELAWEAFDPEAADSRASGTEAFDAESFASEASEPEASEPETFEPEELEAEYLTIDGEDARPEEVWAEEVWAEDLGWTERSVSVKDLAGSADRTEATFTGPGVSTEAETESTFEDLGSFESFVPPSGASVVFPSGLALPYASPGATADPAHADPHGTGLPLLAVTSASLGLRLSKNFTVKELVPAGGSSSTVARISPELVRVLQAIRDGAGRAVRVDAGYRPRGFASPAADTESRHSSGQAADIRISGMSGEQLARLAIDAAGPELAIGVATDGIHLDVRGRWKLWTIIPGQAGADVRNRVALHRATFAPPSPTPPVLDARFSRVRRGILATADPAVRLRLLEAGIAFSQGRARTERTIAGTPTSITARTRATMMSETGIGTPGSPHPTLDANVLFGRVNDDRVEDAYRAWFENPAQAAPPWVLLGVWAKEGLTTAPVGPRVRATDVADARSIWRSLFFFVNMGTDHFVKTIAVPGKDNDIARGPGSGAQHDAVFRSAVAAQVAAGRLPRNIAVEIDAELSVSAVPGAPGEFSVVASRRFAVLSLMLVDAFWRETHAAVMAEVTPKPNPLDLLCMTYMRWNMRASSWRELLRRDMSQNRDPDGSVPSLPVWAFHRRLITGQFTVPRANALRVRLNFVVFRSVYEGN
ncbi:D-Ala-D-Ala carboxypeptidase family metallohydrolase [Planctomonas deserti]|uniref:D-Ala-D-Ala carboxypeptidase family metallohydrolase n=1 Tax=Planctomonas deserti TaxID=2144185 RepID=UPI000D33EFA8|nr:D-Ala-D-Ala carboxypeptidase family metallohydrolase [Planctomonas deserti]